MRGPLHHALALFAAALSTTAVTALAASTLTAQRIVVLNLTGSGVDAALTANLSEVLLGKVRESSPGVAVVGQAEIAAMLSLERQKDLLGCADGEASCLAEIGGALGADHMVSGSVGKVGSVYLVNLRLIKTASAQVVRFVNERVDGDVESLLDAVAQGARHLVDAAQPLGLGYLTVKEPGMISLDGGAGLVAPFQRRPLTAGMHEVVFTNRAGEVSRGEIDIESYRVTLFQSALLRPTASVATADESDDSPWYGKWWLWTLVGVAVAGGATTAVLLTRDANTRSNNPPGPPTAEIQIELDR